MRMFLTILLCKALRFAGGLLGRGSSLPGQIALKFCPDILRRIKLPKYVIAVTGSNGKTSTVEMMAHILQKNGISLIYNKEGSNQIEGVTTFLLAACSLSGRVKQDAVLIESDERFARHTFKYFTPTHYVITNLYRDQLTRNGHPEWVYDILKQSIHDGTQLVLNADDPLVSCFGHGREDNVYFGVERFAGSQEESNSVYDDGKYCPVCKAPMAYAYRHYNHIGSYSCENCGHHRHAPDYAVTEVDLAKGCIVADGKYRIELAFKSIYNVYNILAAYSIARLMGIDGAAAAASISDYMIRNGRVVQFKAGAHAGTLLASKHENSISYNQSIRVATAHEGEVTAAVIVDKVSRKYFTSDTSWLWDIDFEMLAADNIRKIFLAGAYADDLAARFSYTGIDDSRIEVERSVPEAVKRLAQEAEGHIYTITCFSDKEAFLSEVQIVS